MPGPFPGMDPYLEDPAFWQDFHATFLNYWREAIADRLPDPYEARIGERVVLERVDAGSRTVEPDVAIHRGEGPWSREGDADRGVVTLEPTTIVEEEPVVETRQPFIEIRRRPDRALVTVLELLSPSNKTGKDGWSYPARRSDLLRQRIHLVELDLLLGGRHVELSRPLPDGDYFCFLKRSDRPRYTYVYAWGLRDPLPALPIPLRAPDPDLILNYGAVFAVAYERGRYARSLPYDEPPTAAVRPSDREWIAGRVRARHD